MACKFFYFDLGNVLLTFDYATACRNVAGLTGLPVEAVRSAIFESGLQQQYEAGQVTSEQFHERFCQQTGTQPPLDELLTACSAMFELNWRVLPIVAQLRASGHPLGIISNTCEAHWQYVASGRYTVIRDYFPQRVLSFEVGAMKPDPRIFQEALRRVECSPAEVFFVDDQLEHVNAARQCGLDAVPYQSPHQLARELVLRGVRANL